MNILVIGNGFDLAHGLATTYKDFLIFTDSYMSHSAYFSDVLLQEVKNLIEDNGWIRYFKNSYAGKGWIDFEMEISNVIKLVDDKRPQFELLKGQQKPYVRIHPREQEIFGNFDTGIRESGTSDENYISKINKRMQKDLNRLVRCLEIYLDGIINHCPIRDKKIGYIDRLSIDKVLSFNYTNTFARLYDVSGNNDIEYDYIHGKAEVHNTIESNNMVLGIDEYLEDDRKNKDVEFIAFKKYYQRIYKKTGCSYKKWVDKIKADYETYQDKLNIKTEKCFMHNLYVLGHSLDITDRDILRNLILNDNVHTMIYYHNKEAMGRQIANLVRVIGQDELIKRTGGGTETIEFVPLVEMIEAN